MPSDSVAFDRAAGFYDATRGFPPGEDQSIAALIAQAAKFDAATRLLEVGIGTGRVSLPLSRYAGRIVGVDLARPMMQRLLAKRTGEPILLVQGDATELPFASRSFDAVMTVHVLHLIPPWRRALDELKRVLRPGGVMVFGGNNRGEGHPGLQAISEAWRAIIPSHLETAAGMPRGKEQESLAEAGWEQVGEEHVHRFARQRSPAEFIARMEERCWSGTWNMPEDALAQGIEAMREAAAHHFADLDAPVEVQSSFHVRLYHPRA